ncbi:CTP pyrophosphohydrolase [Actinomadura rubteroloni]|uniref:CTP pyrophosphohydrolase n=1 Tax=Actinomadura rubteroloni TaxID=1926885 RepID=A0A2P4ULK5_9ACTN|nr:NUDIX domain-containing protein [Actinomadura rubteroloni]POM25932.1 CTP pyrophosphohydrolase [Actinomadura rubteroloni]
MDEIRAAGVVLWRDGPDGAEIAVVHRPRYDDWSFPKGKVEPGEHVVTTAVRETIEETGVVPVLGRRLPTQRYTVSGRPKRVDYWAAEADGSSFVPNDEVDALDWLPPGEAARRLSYPVDADLLGAFLDGPRRTRPLLIVRHGSAGDKRTFPGPDDLRPLDDLGRDEAVALAGPLAAFGPSRLISSATARCVETLLPLARATGMPVVTAAAVTVGADVDAGTAFLLALAEPAAVCTHGESLTKMVDGLCRALGADVPDDTSLPKGGFWAVHLTPDGVAGLERHSI